MYWACAQVEPRRERLASYCLTLPGYEIYKERADELAALHQAMVASVTATIGAIDQKRVELVTQAASLAQARAALLEAHPRPETSS